MEWKLVPTEATPEMQLAYATAWQRRSIRGLSLGQIGAVEYRAMLAAAPKPPTEEESERHGFTTSGAIGMP